MGKKIIKIMLPWAIVGAVALTGCGGEAKEIAGEAVPDAAAPVESIENVKPVDELSGVDAGETATVAAVGGEAVAEGASGGAENGGASSDVANGNVAADGAATNAANNDVGTANETAASETPKEKKLVDIKKLSDLDGLENWGELYPWIEKLLRERPISEYDSFSQLVLYDEIGAAFKDADGIIYGFFDVEEDTDTKRTVLTGTEICYALVIPLKKLYPNTQWPKANSEETKKFLSNFWGVTVDYSTFGYEGGDNDYGQYAFFEMFQGAIYLTDETHDARKWPLTHVKISISSDVGGKLFEEPMIELVGGGSSNYY